MAVRALYSLEGIKTKAGYFSLNINRSYSWGDSRIGITPAALKQTRQNGKIIFGLDRWGVKFENDTMELPSIFIRTKGKGSGINSIFTVLLSSDEISELGRWFGFEAGNALSGSFFFTNEKTLKKRLMFGVRPIWSELLEPAWRAEFLSWIAGNGGLPVPAEVNWNTSLRGFLTFPALLPQISFSPANRASISGKLVLKEDNGLCRAYFYYKDKFSVYGLSHDNVKFLENGKKIDSDDTYSKNSFMEILGLRPKRKTYEFSRTLKKMSSRKVFSLGSIMGETVGIYANRFCGLKVAKRYYFRVEREEQLLKIRCFSDAKSDKALCYANVLLANGEIAISYIMLQKSD